MVKATSIDSVKLDNRLIVDDGLMVSSMVFEVVEDRVKSPVCGKPNSLSCWFTEAIDIVDDGRNNTSIPV